MQLQSSKMQWQSRDWGWRVRTNLQSRASLVAKLLATRMQSWLWTLSKTIPSTRKSMKKSAGEPGVTRNSVLGRVRSLRLTFRPLALQALVSRTSLRALTTRMNHRIGHECVNRTAVQAHNEIISLD